MALDRPVLLRVRAGCYRQCRGSHDSLARSLMAQGAKMRISLVPEFVDHQAGWERDCSGIAL